MGNIADAMLDGTLCASCGEYLGSGLGCPTLCRRCANDRRSDGHKIVQAGVFFIDAGLEKPASATAPLRRECPKCGRMVAGLADHMRAKHPSQNDNL